jgi:hypothetical protein
VRRNPIIVLIAIGVFGFGCSPQNQPALSNGEFEVFRADWKSDHQALILFESGLAAASYLEVGRDFTCKWTEEEGVVTLTDWQLDELRNNEVGNLDQVAPVVLHRRDFNGTDVLIPQESLEAFDNGRTEDAFLYFKAGPDAVAGFIFVIDEGGSNPRYLRKDF